MSTRPTEPGNYHWRAAENQPWQTSSVFRVFPDRDDVLGSKRLGQGYAFGVHEGIWGPRIPDPTEPGEIPAGGLTDAEIAAGSEAYSYAIHRDETDAAGEGVAAFRRAVAEMREAGR